ncbi:hypothetical protein CkaCkLH20_06208 [Colletotrichum karsti]|uniref:Uncharacterized protein n=1 Tax=Colletotrichum karsti TaxID=1095194 RepID=A0A9P6ICS2_9PEZI|nr:uncharacterized protein CkaCkLH20_06208 [Colletotrichum karsti]KAF9876265.1 hypothetical protein CkaCkLH20_06208 [Colletotrichum karsti]
MAFQALRTINRRAATSLRAPTTTRTFAYTATTRFPYKDSQDRNSLNPGSTEATKSGRDQDAAKDSQAFDPSRTRPEEERAAGGEELESSGANQKQSKPQGTNPDKKGAGKEVKKGGKSKGGSAPKAGSL